jgi:L-iditol 2-dehydrogenase
MKSMMKAAFLEGPKQIVVREVPVPRCPEGGLLTRVEGCAICGTDLRGFEHGSNQVGQITGHEIVGTVIEVGEGVTGFAVGDRVSNCATTCGTCYYCQRGMQNLCPDRNKLDSIRQGGFAEYRPISPEAIAGGFVMKLPSDLPSLEGTLIEPLAAVINGNEKVDIYLDSSVVVIGAGPIGAMHLNLAKLRGAAKTIIVDLLDDRLEAVKKFGADHYVNGANTDPVAEVKRLTGGNGADVVIIACVSGKAQAQAVEMAAKRGQVLFFSGLPANAPTATLNTNLVHYNELRLIGGRSSVKRHFELSIDLLRTKRVDGSKLITSVVPLTDIQKGFEMVKAGQGLKVVVKP